MIDLALAYPMLAKRALIWLARASAVAGCGIEAAMSTRLWYFFEPRVRGMRNYSTIQWLLLVDLHQGIEPSGEPLVLHQLAFPLGFLVKWLGWRLAPFKGPRRQARYKG